MTVPIDLDAEQGRPPGRTPNVFRMTIRKTGSVNLAAIQAYLEGKASFSTTVLEGISKIFKNYNMQYRLANS